MSSSILADQLKHRLALTDPHAPARPRVVVLCGPPGAGKTTLLKHFLMSHGCYWGTTVSHTTRAPRESEVNGRDYWFVDRDAMLKQIENGDFIEHTQQGDRHYGTHRDAIDQVLATKPGCVMDLDPAGVEAMWHLVESESMSWELCVVFVHTRRFETTELRLLGRGTESQEEIDERVAQGQRVLTWMAEQRGRPVTVVLTDVLEHAVAQLCAAVCGD